jgi:hypothetical protein
MPFELAPEPCIKAMAENPFLLANVDAMDSLAFRNLVQSFQLTPLTETGYKKKRFILYRVSTLHGKNPGGEIRALE